MTVQYSVAVRNNLLDSIETTTGASAKLVLYTGTQPANCAAAATGVVLATLSLPIDWMAAASGGTKTLLGTWTVAASGAGTAGYYRILDSAGTTCHEQGSVAIATGGDLNLDNTSVAVGQNITITSKTITAGNP
jgi:hypothetical protein